MELEDRVVKDSSTVKADYAFELDIPDDIYEQLLKIARYKGLDFNSLLIEVCNEYVARHPQV